MNGVPLYLNILTSIATIGAVVIYFFTLREIRRQRENTYRPHLFLNRTYFYVQSAKLGNLYFPTFWHDGNTPLIDPVDFDPNAKKYNRFFIKCYNIGFGSVKNVTVKLSYDVDEFINQIKKLEKKIADISEDLIVDVENDKTLISYIPANPQKLPYNSFGVSPKICFEQYIGYILPVNVDQSSALIEIPFTFLELINIYIFYLANITPIKHKDYDIPLLRIEISYTDISDKKATKVFNVKTNILVPGVVFYNGDFVTIEEL